MNKTSEGRASAKRICAEVAEVPYTQGNVEATGNGLHVGVHCLATTHMEPFEKRAADARRLAACWNACEGISTDSIEGDLKSLLMGAVQRTNAAEALRDELLIALQLIEHATAPTHEDGAYHENAHELARAAIAKATK